MRFLRAMDVPADDVMEFHADDADCSDETDLFFLLRMVYLTADF